MLTPAQNFTKKGIWYNDREMGYKDKEKRREYDKERMRKKRVEQEGRTIKAIKAVSVLPEGEKVVLPETVPASYIVGNKGRSEFLPERPRYLVLKEIGE